MVMKYVNWALRRQDEQLDKPMCPDHHVEMLLRGQMGEPARFRWQGQETYTYIYYCPVAECNQTLMVHRKRSQVPGGTDIPERPPFARPYDR